MSSRSYRSRDDGGTVNGGVSFWYRQIGLPDPRAGAPRRPVRRRLHRRRLASPGCGPPTTWPGPSPTCASSSWRRSSPATAPRAATVAGSPPNWPATSTGTPPPEAGTGVRRLVRAMEQTVDDVIARVPGRGHRRRHRQGRRPARRPHRAPARAAGGAARRARGLGDSARATSAASTRAEVHDRVRVEGALAAVHSPHAARVQPAKLVRGLVDAVRRRGVTVYEGTEVTAIQPGRAVTPHGTVRADVVLRCLEGYTAGAAGQPPGLAADEQLDGGHRAAAAAPSGTRSGGRAPSWSATAPTPTATRSGPPTVASPSAAAGSRTGSARAPTPTA